MLLKMANRCALLTTAFVVMLAIQHSALATAMGPTAPGEAPSAPAQRDGLSPGPRPLETGFLHPPDSARPWVNWFWLDGNITRKGITADLQAMRRVGIGGVLLMDVTQKIPPGPVKFGSQKWHDLLKHAVSEAARLGLKFSINNGPGWTGSGGPWITPALSMQVLTSSMTNITGPVHFEGYLPPIRKGAGYCLEVATLAFPTLVGDGAPLPGPPPKVTASAPAGFNGARFVDGNQRTFVTLPPAAPGHPQYVELEFQHSISVSHFDLHGAGPRQFLQGALQVSNNGHSFKAVRQFMTGTGDVSLEIEPVKARYFRIAFTQSRSPLNRIELAEVALYPRFQIPFYHAKSGLSRHVPAHAASGTIPSYGIIRPNEVIDLSSKVDSQGRLAWNVPKGQWTVLRFGSISTGRMNPPARPGGYGLECDKLSRRAIDVHFNSYLARLKAETGAAGQRAFTFTHIDSYETGFQNWTPDFLKEFQRRRGYSALPYLPAMTGRFVESPAVSDRFLWDVRRTIADLFADNYAGRLAELAHQHGMKLSIEAYGDGPFDDLLYAAQADVPMSEFWNQREAEGNFQTSKTMASAAHTAGKRIVAAEAFTAWPFNAKWQNHPFTLKWLADRAFCAGVNRLVIHRFAHQPWLNRRPGMTMGMWGVEYDRTETWWEDSKPWHDYLARCQFLLQQGRFVADVCYLTGEGAYTEPPARDQLQPALPKGYDYDVASPEVVLDRMSVTNGRVALPDGMSYRLLVLAPRDHATPAFLRKIKRLVEAGATVIGPPPATSPSLSGYPQCDREVESLASQLWANCNGKTITQKQTGRGRIIWGRPLKEVLAEMDVPPDFRQLTTTLRALTVIHRRAGGADVYFVASPNSTAVQADCEFRVQGRMPEFWHPDTGRIEEAGIWHPDKGGTAVLLKLHPFGSVFVVFRKPSNHCDPIVSVRRNGGEDASADVSMDVNGHLRLLAKASGAYELKTASGKSLQARIPALPDALAIKGPWRLSFPPHSGAPARIFLNHLISWTEDSHPGVRYFSGTATYRNAFWVPPGFLSKNRRAYLDLGAVDVIADVTLNGEGGGILWKPPFRVDVTRLLKPGLNRLEIKVTNLWPNRRIGDDQLPPDCDWLDSAPGATGSPLRKWPEWLKQDKPSPTGRLTFATWKFWTKDSPLLESGLLGPVLLRPVQALVVR